MRANTEIAHIVASHRVAAKRARRRNEWSLCWQLLEDAHVLSQPWVRLHIQVHASMLVAGWKAKDFVEVRGQILRLVVGGPASAIGRYPLGNTGRARVSAIQPMPIKSDLERYLARAGQRTGDLADEM